MRKVLLTLVLIGTSFIGKSQAVALTGSVIIESLRSSANSIVNNAGEQAKQVANEAAARLMTIAAELERALGDNVKKPINELNATLRMQTDRALVALQQTRDFIASMLPCLKSDLKLLIGSFNSTITNNISNITFWKKKNPIVYNIEKIDASTSYGYRINNKATFLLEGANFDFNSHCLPVVTITNVDDEKYKISAKILQKDMQKVTIATTEPFKKVGLYQIDIIYKSKYFLGCFGEKTIKAFISVLPEAVFNVSYNIIPFCVQRDVIPFDAGRIDDTNDGCDGDKFPEIVGTLPGDLTYVSHTFYIESGNGTEKTVDQYLGSNNVRIKFRLPKPNCVWTPFGPKRIGERTWIHGKLVINGQRVSSSQKETITGTITGLTYDMTKSIKIPINTCNEIDKWNVSVSIIFPDGKPTDIPPMEGKMLLTNSVNGVTYIWEPSSGTLSITTPAYPCN